MVKFKIDLNYLIKNYAFRIFLRFLLKKMELVSLYKFRWFDTLISRFNFSGSFFTEMTS